MKSILPIRLNSSIQCSRLNKYFGGGFSSGTFSFKSNLTATNVGIEYQRISCRDLIAYKITPTSLNLV